MTRRPRLEGMLRELTPQVLGALVRRYGQFDRCEDAVQEALLAASVQWPEEGLPENPRGWLITVASRRLADQLRSESARRRREEAMASQDGTEQAVAPAPDADQSADIDDTLTLLVLCCHPSLSQASQVALTLRAVGGLTTAEIARAFLVPESTMAQRISRAKQRIRATGSEFRMPPDAEMATRMTAVLQVLYLVFNEGYTSTSGPDLARADLTWEAIRLARMVFRLLPDDGEVAGLLALMLLTEARRPARTTADGSLVPLAEQDRRRWNSGYIAEGVDLISRTLTSSPLGRYQLQAAIGRDPRRGAHRAGHRLAADRGVVRVAGTPLAHADGQTEPGGGCGDGQRPGGRAEHAGPSGHRPPDGRSSPFRRGAGASAGDGRRPGSGQGQLPQGRTSNHQPAGEALPRGTGCAIDGSGDRLTRPLRRLQCGSGRDQTWAVNGDSASLISAAAKRPGSNSAGEPRPSHSSIASWPGWPVSPRVSIRSV